MATNTERIAQMEQARKGDVEKLDAIKLVVDSNATALGELQVSHAEHLQAHKTTRRIATGILAAAMFLLALFGLTK